MTSALQHSSSDGPLTATWDESEFRVESRVRPPLPDLRIILGGVLIISAVLLLFVDVFPLVFDVFILAWGIWAVFFPPKDQMSMKTLTVNLELTSVERWDGELVTVPTTKVLRVFLDENYLRIATADSGSYVAAFTGGHGEEIVDELTRWLGDYST